MAGEPLKCEDFISLEKYMEARFSAMETLTSSKFQSLEKLIDRTFELNDLAIRKAEDSVNLRLEAMNEFRAAMKDQQTIFFTKAEFDAYNKSHESEYQSHLKTSATKFEDLKDKLNELDTMQKIVATKASMPMVYIIGAGSIIGLILSILSLITKLGGP